MSAIPYKNSRRHELMLAFKEHGPMNADQLMRTKSNWYGFINSDQCKVECWWMVKRGTLVQSGELFDLSAAALDYCEMNEVREVQEKAPLTLPAYVNIWTPAMRGYEASLRRGMRA